MECVNNAEIVGYVVGDVAYDHTSKLGVDYGMLTVAVPRLSYKEDEIQVMGQMKRLQEFQDGDYVMVYGEFCSYNFYEGEGKHLKLYLTAHEMYLYDGPIENSIRLTGYICKQPVLRKTPFGRTVCDLVIAINKGTRSSYIPCICWGENANDISKASVGELVTLFGRIQSRTYYKNEKRKTAYEVSVDVIDFNS